MLTRDDVQIDSPCGLDFSKMTRAEATKRFCGDCRKHVHDLTRLTPGEIRELLATPATEGLCVRYVADERGRLVTLPDVPTSALTRAKRIVLAAAALAAPLSLTACMGARAPMRNELPTASLEAPRPGDAFVAIKGATMVRVTNTPGMLVDETAAPPPPGQTPDPHPFLSGSCGGDPRGCSEARELLESATSTADFLERLRDAGYNVGPNLR
jgi:hypothetical protein